jgi:Putative zinc-finger
VNCMMETYLGGYVLLALSAEETERVREHLESCPACQAILRDFEPLPPLLGIVSAEQVAALDRPRPDLLERLLRDVHEEQQTPGEVRQRRMPRRRVLLAAALIAVTAGVGSASVLEHLDRPLTVVQAENTNTGLSAKLSLTPRREGTQLSLSLSGVSPGERCSLIAHARDGRTDTAASWTASYTGTANVSGTTAIAAAQLTSLDIVTDDGRHLLTLDVTQ